MPTPPATGKTAKVDIDLRDLLEIQRTRKADAGKKTLSLNEAWKKLGLKK